MQKPSRPTYRYTEVPLVPTRLCAAAGCYTKLVKLDLERYDARAHPWLCPWTCETASRTRRGDIRGPYWYGRLHQHSSELIKVMRLSACVQSLNSRASDSQVVLSLKLLRPCAMTIHFYELPVNGGKSDC
jgi:hypothetical protein